MCQLTYFVECLQGLCKQLNLDDKQHHDQLQKDIRTLVFAKLKQELSHIPDFQGELEQGRNKLSIVEI